MFLALRGYIKINENNLSKKNNPGHKLTKGKHYVAKSWNIEKFTNNRYKNISLNETPEPIQEKNSFFLKENLKEYNYKKTNDYIILFENDLFKENRIKFYSRYKKIIILLLENKFRKIQISESVFNFKKL